MPTLLLKLIPFRDYAYAALALAAVAFWFYHDHVEQEKGAARVTAAYVRGSQKATADAQKRIQTLTDQHAADVAKIEDNYETLLASADTEHGADLKRLRDYDAYRKAHPVLDGAASNGAQTDGGAGSLGRLEQVSAGLAAALRDDDAALMACYADRDSLTGK